jgi:hypothetical protein
MEFRVSVPLFEDVMYLIQVKTNSVIWLAEKNCRQKTGRCELPFLQAISPSGKAELIRFPS